MITRTQVDLSMSSRLERIKKNPRRPVKDPFMQTLNFLKETSTRRNPAALLLRCWVSAQRQRVLGQGGHERCQLDQCTVDDDPESDHHVSLR